MRAETPTVGIGRMALAAAWTTITAHMRLSADASSSGAASSTPHDPRNADLALPRCFVIAPGDIDEEGGVTSEAPEAAAGWRLMASIESDYMGRDFATSA